MQRARRRRPEPRAMLGVTMRIDRRMPRHDRRFAAIARFLALLGFLFLLPATFAGTEETVVVLHAQEHPTAAFSRGALQAIFGMRLRTWPDGSAIKVFVLPDNHPAHIAFCKNVLHVFPHEMRSAWDRLVFSGTGQAPIEVATEEAMRAKLATTPGAIGYLSNAAANDTAGAITVVDVK